MVNTSEMEGTNNFSYHVGADSSFMSAYPSSWSRNEQVYDSPTFPPNSHASISLRNKMADLSSCNNFPSENDDSDRGGDSNGESEDDLLLSQTPVGRKIGGCQKRFPKTEVKLFIKII